MAKSVLSLNHSIIHSSIQTRKHHSLQRLAQHGQQTDWPVTRGVRSRLLRRLRQRNHTRFLPRIRKTSIRQTCIIQSHQASWNRTTHLTQHLRCQNIQTGCLPQFPSFYSNIHFLPFKTFHLHILPHISTIRYTFFNIQTGKNRCRSISEHSFQVE